MINIHILPIIFYAAPVWLQYNIDKFDDIIYEMLKSCLGLMFKPSKIMMMSICGFTPLILRYRIFCMKFIHKIFFSNDINDILRINVIGKFTHNCLVLHHMKLLREFICFCYSGNLRSSRLIDLNLIPVHRYTLKNIADYEFKLKSNYFNLNYLVSVTDPIPILSKPLKFNFSKFIESKFC